MKPKNAVACPVSTPVWVLCCYLALHAGMPHAPARLSPAQQDCSSAKAAKATVGNDDDDEKKKGGAAKVPAKKKRKAEPEATQSVSAMFAVQAKAKAKSK